MQYSGDPILSSGGDIVFQGDQVPPNSGNYTTICTGSGTFSGTNAYIDPAHPCTLISTSGLVLNLSGFADLSGASISSGSGVSITAGTGISTGNITAPSGIILKTSSGNISAGSLSANNNFIQLQADSGSISTGALSASNAALVVSGKSFSAPSVALTSGGALDIYVNQATPFQIGGLGANVGTLSLSGITTTGGSFIHVKNSGAGGITVASTSAININTPYQQSYLALDASTGVLNLPAGTISLDSNLFPIPAGIIALSAGQINANGTTLSASNTAGGYAGAVVMGASAINTGNGLDVHTDGAFGFVGVGGHGVVSITSTPVPPLDFLQVDFNGNNLYPITLQGQSFTATSNGYQGQVNFDGSAITLAGGNVNLTANGTGYGSSGFVQLYANQINNSANVLATANGAASDAGGFVQVTAAAPSSDLTVGQGKLAVFANGGPSGGDGGEIDISAGHTLSVDTGSIGSSALGGNGWGGRVTLVGGTPGFAGGGVVFTNPNASINANGQGSGDGGLVQIGAFGNGSNLTLPSISANGGATGSGGWIDSTINNNLTISGTLSANAGSAGNGSGGTIHTYAGLNGLGSISLSADLSANGAGSGTGGRISLYTDGNFNIQNNNTPSVGISAKGGSTGDGGTILLGAGHSTTITNAIVNASAGTSGDGAGGYIAIESGYTAPSDLNVTAALIADGEGNGQGGTIVANSYWGNATLNHPVFDATSISATGGSVGGQSADGGYVQIQAAGDLNLQSGDVDVSSLTPAGNGGTIVLSAGLGGVGNLTNSGTIQSKAGPDGVGGSVILNAYSGDLRVGFVSSESVLAQTGSTGNLEIDGDINATGVKLIANGTGSIFHTSGAIFASSLELRSGSGDIGSEDNFVLAAVEQLTVVTPGSIYMDLPRDTDLLETGEGKTIHLISDPRDLRIGFPVHRERIIFEGFDNIFVNAGLTATESITLQASDQVLVNSLVTAGLFGSVSISAGKITQGGSTSARVEGFTTRLETSQESIGTATMAISVSTPNLIVGSADDAFINSIGSLKISTIFARNLLSVSTTDSETPFLGLSGRGDVTIEGAVNARDARFRTGSNTNGDITITSAGSVTGTDLVSMIANGSGSINSAGSITSQSIFLGSQTGNIGRVLQMIGPGGTISTTVLPMIVSSQNLTVSTSGSISSTDFGGVAISNIGLLPLKVEDSQAGAQFVLTTLGSLSVGSISMGNISGTGLIGLASGGPLDVRANSSLFAVGGSIAIANTFGPITIHSGTNIGALEGNVLIQSGLGPVILGDPGNTQATFITAATNTSRSDRGNVLISTLGGSGQLTNASTIDNLIVTSLPNVGFVKWGPSRVLAAAPANTATAANRFITLDASSGLLPIILNGSVNIGAAGQTSAANGASGFAPGHSSPDNPAQANLVPPGPPNMTQPPGFYNNPGHTDVPSPGQQQKQQSQQKKAMQDSKEELLIAQSKSTEREYLPVSYTTVASTSTSALRKAQLKTADAWMQENMQLHSADNDRSLRLVGRGHVVISARKPLQVHTEEGGCVNFRAGTIAMISASAGIIKVLNLHDKGKDSLKVAPAGETDFELGPGKEIIFTRSESHLADKMARRHIQHFSLLNGHLWISEYSLLSAIGGNPLLNSMFDSYELGGFREKVLKTAACLGIVTGRRGPFSSQSTNDRPKF